MLIALKCGRNGVKYYVEVTIAIKNGLDLNHYYPLFSQIQLLAPGTALCRLRWYISALKNERIIYVSYILASMHNSWEL